MATEILPRLFLGNIDDARTLPDVDTVINCTSTIPFSNPHNNHIRIAIEDNGDQPKESFILFDAIKDGTLFARMDRVLGQGKRILVHCHAGRQRSAALVACYLINRFNKDNPGMSNVFSADMVIAFIVKKRREAFFGDVNFHKAVEMYEMLYTNFSSKQVL